MHTCLQKILSFHTENFHIHLNMTKKGGEKWDLNRNNIFHFWKRSHTILARTFSKICQNLKKGNTYCCSEIHFTHRKFCLSQWLLKENMLKKNSRLSARQKIFDTRKIFVFLYDEFSIFIGEQNYFLTYFHFVFSTSVKIFYNGYLLNPALVWHKAILLRYYGKIKPTSCAKLFAA